MLNNDIEFFFFFLTNKKKQTDRVPFHTPKVELHIAANV